MRNGHKTPIAIAIAILIATAMAQSPSLARGGTQGERIRTVAQPDGRDAKNTEVAYSPAKLRHELRLADAESARVTFDIPAQPLADSLKAVANQTKANVLFDLKMVAGLKAPALKAQLTLEEAIARLLSGTQFEQESVDEHTIVVTNATHTSFAASAAGPLRLAQSIPSTETGEDRSEIERDQAKTDPANTSSSSSTHAPTDESFKDLDAKAIAEVTVRGVKDTGLVNQGVIPRQPNEAVRYDVIDRGAIARSGATSVPELFRSLSSNATMGTNSQQALSQQLGAPEGVLAINDTVNLRGLGSEQTLVMVNGRRLFGGEGTGADLSRIPVEAIERIELLPTSGSAIYGANAVGGVINIILRKDYDGSDVSLYYGSASDGSAAERRVTYHNGTRLNDGRTNLSLIAEVESKEPLLMRNRRYYEDALERISPSDPVYVREIVRNLIGPVGTVSSGSGYFPPSLGLGIHSDPGAAYAAIPHGSSGVGLTPASFNATPNTANVSTERMDRATLLRGSDSYSLFATLEHSMLEGRIGAYAELSWRYADTSTDSVVGVLTSFRADSDNPLNPFRTDVTPGFPGVAANVFLDPVDLPSDSATSYQRTLRAVGGLKGRLEVGSSHTYNWAIDASWDRNETYARNVSYTRNIGAAVSAGFYNPFRDLSQVQPITGAQLESFAWANVQRSDPEIVATNLRVNGDLFGAWGGPARFSLGLELRVEDEHFTSVDTAGAYGDLPDAQFPSMSSDRDTHRRATAGYLELVLPLVADQNHVPFVRELEFVGAIRMERYSDFGAASPPMAGIKYKPFRDLILRASYSEGFQPPTQSELIEPVQTVDVIGGFGLLDPQRNFEEVDSVAYAYGGNPDLRPETSDTWDAGLIYSPAFVPGLQLSASYFRYDKFDVVGVPNLQDLVDLVPDRITRGAPLPGDSPGTPGPITFIDASFINLARQFVDGWDFKVDYARKLGGDRATGLTVDATRTDRYELQQVEGSPVVDRVGENGLLTGGAGVLHWRGKSSLWVEAGDMSLSWNSRYIDSYVTDTTTPTADTPDRTGVDGSKIPSTLEHDLVFTYSMPGDRGGVLSHTRFTAGILNVFDHAPPPVSTRISMWYSGYNDPRQRVYYLQLRKAF